MQGTEGRQTHPDAMKTHSRLLSAEEQYCNYHASDTYSVWTMTGVQLTQAITPVVLTDVESLRSLRYLLLVSSTDTITNKLKFITDRLSRLVTSSNQIQINQQFQATKCRHVRMKQRLN